MRCIIDRSADGRLCCHVHDVWWPVAANVQELPPFCPVAAEGARRERAALLRAADGLAAAERIIRAMAEEVQP